jgi:hypothetical protein
MSVENQCITVATDDSICNLIHSANHRLVFLAPALHEKVAQALASQWDKLGADRVSVILDLDAEVFRLGYGELSALKLLEETATRLGTMIQRQPGIRIGLIVADEVTLIYSPTPLLIEAGPTKPDPSRPSTPNAIRLDHTPQRIVAEVGHGEEGRKDQKIGLDKAKAADVAKVEVDLKQNPPQPFDITRKVRVFNAAFEFVDFELSGTSIDQMTVPIPKYLSGIRDRQTREQLRTSFRLVPQGHKLSGEHLTKDRNLIAKKFLHNITKFGTVVLRSRKNDFQREVQQLREAVTKFSGEIRAQLAAVMDKNRENLVKSLLPQVKRNPPKEWLKSDGTRLDAETLKQFLDGDLRQAFGTADRLIKHMEVRLVFKAVTYELLSNTEFMEAAQKAIPELAKLYEEFDAAKAVERHDGMT